MSDVIQLLPDSADAVHDRHIVAVARLHIIAQLRIVLSGTT